PGFGASPGPGLGSPRPGGQVLGGLALVLAGLALLVSVAGVLAGPVLAAMALVLLKRFNRSWPTKKPGLKGYPVGGRLPELSRKCTPAGKAKGSGGIGSYWEF